MIKLLLHTLSTSTSVTGDCIIYWQNPPKQPPTLPGSSAAQKPVLIDATTLSLDAIYSRAAPYRRITIVGADLLLALKIATAHQILTFIRSLSQRPPQSQQQNQQAQQQEQQEERIVTVILNSDDALRSGEHEVLLTALAHASHSVLALRELPSGRDKEFAGMARFTRGYTCIARNNGGGGEEEEEEGERLYKYRENMMVASMHH